MGLRHTRRPDDQQKTLYQQANGKVRAFSRAPLPFDIGIPRVGGFIIPEARLVFFSGTMYYYLGGYDLKTEKEIWRHRLPAGGQATALTYLGADDLQYLVAVAGGYGSTGTRAGDAIMAYALRRR